jgi:hypothetical protein
VPSDRGEPEMPYEAFDAMDPARQNILKAGDWSLCIGAGVCHGLMPDWSTITQRMLGRAYRSAVDSSEIKLLVDNLSWSLDSLLQHALNTYLITGRNVDDFNNDLALELYEKVLADALADGVDAGLTRLLSNPFSRDPTQVLKLESFLTSRYAQSSLMQIARFLLRARGASRNPTAVLTFNADVLLHAELFRIGRPEP